MFGYKKALLPLAITLTLGTLASPIYAQDVLEEVVVTGSIQDALLQSREFKRNSTSRNCLQASDLMPVRAQSNDLLPEE